MPEPAVPHEPPPRQPAHRTTAAVPAPPAPAPRQSAPTRRRTSRPVVRASRSGRGWVWGLLLILALGGGAYYYYFKLRPDAARTRATPPLPTAIPVGDSTLARFEATADSAMSVVRNYGDRARLFASRQITCAELTRGFAAVENQMLAYGTARKALRRPLDPAHVARDQALFAAVDTVDAQFDRSRCPRP